MSFNNYVTALDALSFRPTRRMFQFPSQSETLLRSEFGRNLSRGLQPLNGCAHTELLDDAIREILNLQFQVAFPAFSRELKLKAVRIYT
jgi:hypothetical protein